MIKISKIKVSIKKIYNEIKEFIDFFGGEIITRIGILLLFFSVLQLPSAFLGNAFFKITFCISIIIALILIIVGIVKMIKE